MQRELRDINLEQRQGAVSFVTGGVGTTGLEPMAGMSGEFAVELMLVARSAPNRYLAGIRSEIRDKDGTVVLDAMAQGPLMLVNPPKGIHTVSAGANGKTERGKARVGSGKSERIVFVFDEPVDVDS